MPAPARGRLRVLAGRADAGRAAASEAYDGLSNRVELDISGMTCAACASRIEKKLNRLDGVEASVNYATEQAHVTFDDAVYELTFPSPYLNHFPTRRSIATAGTAQGLAQGTG